MKIEINTKDKRIRLTENANLGELFTFLEEILPDLKWREYSIEGNVVYSVSNPIVVNPITPYIPNNSYPITPFTQYPNKWFTWDTSLLNTSSTEEIK